MVEHEGGVLDLGALEPAPLKVKLPDGKLYDMAPPGALGARQLQRLVSRHRRAMEILDAYESSDPEVEDANELEEMLDLMVDVCQVIVPDAPRDVLGDLDLIRQQRLAQAFFDASPAETGETETVSTSES